MNGKLAKKGYQNTESWRFMKNSKLERLCSKKFYFRQKNTKLEEKCANTYYGALYRNLLFAWVRIVKCFQESFLTWYFIFFMSRSLRRKHNLFVNFIKLRPTNTPLQAWKTPKIIIISSRRRLFIRNVSSFNSLSRFVLMWFSWGIDLFVLKPFFRY